jgi:hypothetical protein
MSVIFLNEICYFEWIESNEIELPIVNIQDLNSYLLIASHVYNEMANLTQWQNNIELLVRMYTG